MSLIISHSSQSRWRIMSLLVSTRYQDKSTLDVSGKFPSRLNENMVYVVLCCSRDPLEMPADKLNYGGADCAVSRSDDGTN